MSEFNGFELGDGEGLEIMLNAINHELERRKAAGESLDFENPDDPMGWLTPALWAAAEARVNGVGDE
jgi:hypothetical protein